MKQSTILFKAILKRFKNTTKTLAKKQQRYLALHWESFSQCRLTIGSGKTVKLRELSKGPEVATKLDTTASNSVLSEMGEGLWHRCLCFV